MAEYERIHPQPPHDYTVGDPVVWSGLYMPPPPGVGPGPYICINLRQIFCCPEHGMVWVMNVAGDPLNANFPRGWTAECWKKAPPPEEIRLDRKVRKPILEDA